MSRHDFTQEYPRALHVVHEKLAGTSDWPAFIDRDAYTQEEIQALPDRAFADTVARQFPIHEKAATYLSAVSYYGQCEPDAQLESSLEKAAAIHGISQEFGKVKELLFGWEKTASIEKDETMPKFALSIDYGDSYNPDVRDYLPIDSEADIEDSSMELAKTASANQIPIEVAHVAARNIIKAAAAFKMDPSRIHESCRRIGGSNSPDFQKAAELIEFRSQVPGMDSVGLELYRDLVKGASANEDQLDDFIKLAIQTDIAYGVSYDDLHLDPYQIFLSGDSLDVLRKMASNTVGIDGVLVPRELFCRIPQGAVMANFDTAAFEKISRAQEDARTNTKEASSALETLLPEERSALLDLAMAASV